MGDIDPVLVKRLCAMYSKGDVVKVLGETYGFVGVVDSDGVDTVYVEYKGNIYKVDKLNVEKA